MPSTYPTALDAFATTKQDDTHSQTGADQGTSTTVGDHATHHNDLADAVNKVEAELGADPSAGFATLRERFEANDWKLSVRAATTVALPTNTLAAGVLTASANGALAAQDGVTLSVGDRLLVKAEGTPAKNGIYTVTALGSGAAPWSLTRAVDADTAAKCSDSLIVTVEQGTQAADSGWELTTDNPITLGTTALRFTRLWPDYAERSPWVPSPGTVENLPRGLCRDNQTITSGTMRCTGGFVLRAGRAVSSVVLLSATTAASAPTHQWCALIRASDRSVLAVTANQTTGAWAANTPKTFTFATPYVPDADVAVYVGVVVVATTPPSFPGFTGLSSSVLGHAPIIAGNSSTGLTAPVAVGTIVTALTAQSAWTWAALG